MKAAILLIAVLAGCLCLAGCSGGDISVSDVQKNAKEQQDWIKAHPAPPGDHIEQ